MLLHRYVTLGPPRSKVKQGLSVQDFTEMGKESLVER